MMAFTNPVTWVAGATLTAAELNEQVRDNSLAGGPIYTTETARDAAIPTPYEGQRAYITSPTVTSPTGATFAGLPTGIQTVYNGSIWVCVTPIAAITTTSGTTTSTAFTPTLTGGGTNPSVTIVTGPTALITQTAHLSNSTTGAGAYMTVAVSGATTVAATADLALHNGGTGGAFFLASATVLISALSGGANTFTLAYKCGTSGTSTFAQRQLIVRGVA